MNTEKNASHEEMLAEVKAWLAGIEIGEGVHHRNLTVFPLRRRRGTDIHVGRSGRDEDDATVEKVRAREALDRGLERNGSKSTLSRLAKPAQDRVKAPDGVPEGADPSSEAERYVLLADAIEAEQATVQEIDEGGQVPFLGVVNAGAKPILIPEGEILIGAKQNRSVNITVLVAGGITFKLPVSCVERGRWRYATRHFEAASYAHPTLREKKLKSAQRNRRMAREAVSDQGEVWEEVDHHLHEMAACSPTADVVDALRVSEGLIEDYRRIIDLPDGACGFLAVRGGEVVGVDLFDSAITMKKMWNRLGDAYFVGALREREAAPASRDLAEAFLAAVTRNLEPAPEQPDLGFELELDGDDLAGMALWHDGAVCHLAAFPVAQPSAGGDEYGFEMAG